MSDFTRGDARGPRARAVLLKLRPPNPRAWDRIYTVAAALSPRPWSGDSSGRTALVPPAGRSAGSLLALRSQGFERARTGALTQAEAAPLLQRGWKVAAHLHLLRHSMRVLPPAHPREGPPLRRGRESDLAAAATLDDDAFPLEWRLGRAGLTDALKATPQSRFRIARGADGPVGYAICGRSGRDGYVQRLAVSAAHRGQGLGRALTLDGLRWLRRWKATSASVNTYVGNDVALRLYQSLGFAEVRPGLMVLTIDL